MAVDVGSAVGYLDLDISGFLKGLKTAQQESQNTTQSIADKVSKKFSTVGKSLTSAGSTLAKGVTTPIVGLGTAIIKTGADFEAAMSKVQAISGASGSDMSKLTEKAREMGKSTKWSAEESAQAFQYMAMAGWDTKDMLNSIAGVMDLAAADGLDLATTSDIVTDAMTAFGLAADGTTTIIQNGISKEIPNATHFADVLAKASSSANTNVSMLGESFKYVAPVAGALGYTVEDTSIALGLMANSGIKASQAGTALRTLMTRMAKPTKESGAAMSALGVTLDDGQGHMKSFRQVMDDLRKGFGQCKIPQDEFQNGLTQLQMQLENGEISQKEYNSAVEELTERAYGAEGAEKAKYAAMLAGQEGMAGLLAIVNASSKDYETLTNAIDNCNGAAHEMAEIQMNNLKGKLTYLKSELGEVAIQFFNLLAPSINKAVDKIRDMVAWVSNLSEEMKKWIIRIAEVAAAIAPCLLVLGKLTSGIGKAIKAFDKVKDIASGLTMFKRMKEATELCNAGFVQMAKKASTLGTVCGQLGVPIGVGVAGAVAAFGILVAAFATLWNTNEDFRNKMTEIWNKIKDTIKNFVDDVKQRFSDLGISMGDIVGTLKAIWQGFCDLLAPVFEAAFSLVSTVLSTILNALVGVLDIFIGLFTGNWEQCWRGIKEVFGAIWDGIKGVLSTALDLLKGLLDAVCGWFGTTWSNTWTNIKNFFSDIWNGIVTVFQTVWTYWSNLFTAAINFVKVSWENGWNSVKEFFSNIWNGIVGVFQTVWSFWTGVFTSAIEWVQNAWQTGWNTVKEFFSNIWNGITDFLSSAWETIKNVVQVGLMAVAELINIAFTLITLPFRFIWENCKEIIISAWESIKEKVSTALEAVATRISISWNAVKATFTIIWSAIKVFFETIWNSIKDTVSTLVDAIKAKIELVWNGIKSVTETIWNGIKTFFETVWNGIKTFIETVINGIKDIITTVWNAIKTFTTTLWNGIKNTLSSIWEGIKSIVTSVINKIKDTVTNVFNSVKTTVTNIWNGIKNAISNAINGAKDTTTNTIDSMKNKVSNVFSSIRSIASNTWESIKEAIRRPIESARDLVSNAIERIKSKFNFSWSLPHLSLPHFSISGSFSLKPPSVPHFSVSWYKKGMDGLIMDAPTIFGFDPNTGKFLGGGEAGSETIVGTNNLMKMIRQAVSDTVSLLLSNWDSSLVQLYSSVNSLRTNFNNLLQQLKVLTGSLATDLSNAFRTVKLSFDYPEWDSGSNDDDKLEKLRRLLEELLKDNPMPTPQVDVHFNGGDIYMDKERTGRALAPTISRIIATTK